MQKPDSVKCANCIFYTNGMCKRYPPQFTTDYVNINLNNSGSTLNGSASPNTFAKWPYVNDLDFCGEFVPNDNLTAIEWVAWKKGLKDDLPS